MNDDNFWEIFSDYANQILSYPKDPDSKWIYPKLEDDIEFDKYFDGTVLYIDWLQQNNSTDSLESRIQYFQNSVIPLIRRINDRELKLNKLSEEKIQEIETLIPKIMLGLSIGGFDSDASIFVNYIFSEIEGSPDEELYSIIMLNYFDSREDLFNVFFGPFVYLNDSDNLEL